MSKKSTKTKQKQNITKITAKPDKDKTPKVTKDERIAKNKASTTETKTQEVKPSVAKDKKPQQPAKKTKKSKESVEEKPLKEVFILARPFVALGRYLRDSWREIRQVRWPNRGATWKMTLAVLIYCAIFALFILLLDTFFTFIFNLLLGTN